MVFSNNNSCSIVYVCVCVVQDHLTICFVRQLAPFPPLQLATLTSLAITDYHLYVV